MSAASGPGRASASEPDGDGVRGPSPRARTTVLPVFVYGTLRLGSWNHERWLAPWLAGPCRPAHIAGYALHHLDGLPYLVADPMSTTLVRGDVADLDPARYDAAVANLDLLEDVAGGHLVRVEGDTVEGERALMYVAGPLVADLLGPSTRLGHGDWLAVA